MNLATTLKLDATARFDGEWQGEAFWFEAKTHKLTPKMMQRFADAKAVPFEYAQAVADVVTAWDIDMNGEPFPPIAENLAQLPYEFLDYLLDKIGASWSGNEQKPSQSANGSAAAA